MKVGKELDELVAEKVMGWKDVWQPFQPSTDIADAWEVVEDLKYKFDYTVLYHSNDSWIFTLQNILPPIDDGLAEVQEYKTEAETPELAICLTALKSVGYEMEETA